MPSSAAQRVLARHRERVTRAAERFGAASRAYASDDEAAFEAAARDLVALAVEAGMDERDTLRGEDTPDDLVRRMTRKRLIVGALRDWAVEVESRRPEMGPEVSRP
jgi:hypothetical protein